MTKQASENFALQEDGSPTELLNAQETSRTDPAAGKQAAGSRSRKESKVPVLAVDLCGIRKKKADGDNTTDGNLTKTGED